MAQPANKHPCLGGGQRMVLVWFLGVFFVVFLLCPKLYVILLILGGGEVKFQAVLLLSCSWLNVEQQWHPVAAEPKTKCRRKRKR